MMYYGTGIKVVSNQTCCCTSTVCTCNYQPGTTSVTLGDSNQIVVVVTEDCRSLREREMEAELSLRMASPLPTPRERPPRFANHRKTVHHRPPAYRRACY